VSVFLRSAVLLVGVYASAVPDSVVFGEASDGEGGFELLAASLRRRVVISSPLLRRWRTSWNGLCRGELVERRPVRRFSKDKRVARIEVALGDERFIAVASAGVVETLFARAVSC
jgi:hypothetical protein